MADNATAFDFSAERIVKIGKKVVTAHVNAKDDRWRFEFAQPQGDASIIIVRVDRQSSWLIVSKRRQYLEVPIARDHQLTVSETMKGEVSRELVGDETLNGYPTELFEVTVSENGGERHYYQWVTKAQRFPVKTVSNGLSAVGEVASTGVHGANRLASNSLLEAVVFGARIGERLKSERLQPRKNPAAPEDRYDLAPKPADPALMMRLRKAMSKGAALIRSEKSLGEVIDVINDLNQNPLVTSGLKSALASAELIAQGALMREESRGGHFRSDFPETDEEPMHTEICLAETADLEWEEELS